MLGANQTGRQIAGKLGLVTAFALGFCLQSIAAPEENGKTFEAAGATIYYEMTGSGAGTPLLLVNGGPGIDHTYLHVSPVWGALAKSRHIVFYDQRGTGHSVGAHEGQALTLKDQIEDLEALRAHLGIERVDLLGHSWGGYLAMAYAAVHPDRIAHLIIVDSLAPRIKDSIFLFDEVFPEGTERKASVAFADEMGDTAATNASNHEYMSMLFYSPEKRDLFIAAVPPTTFNKAVNKAVWNDLDRFDLNPEIRKFKFPTLVITGRYDMNAAPLVAYRIHQAIPGSRYLVFERSGHMPFIEEPEKFAQAVGEFISAK